MMGRGFITEGQMVDESSLADGILHIRNVDKTI